MLSSNCIRFTYFVWLDNLLDYIRDALVINLGKFLDTILKDSLEIAYVQYNNVTLDI
jgi:hypothetical protein